METPSEIRNLPKNCLMATTMTTRYQDVTVHYFTCKKSAAEGTGCPDTSKLQVSTQLCIQSHRCVFRL